MQSTLNIKAQKHNNKLKTVEDISRHIFGGASTFTVVNVKYGQKIERPYYTFKVNVVKRKNFQTGDLERTNLFKVSMLNGPDNDAISNYKEIGHIKVLGNSNYFFDSKFKFPKGRTAEYIKAIKYITEKLLPSKKIPQWSKFRINYLNTIRNFVNSQIANTHTTFDQYVQYMQKDHKTSYERFVELAMKNKIQIDDSIEDEDKIHFYHLNRCCRCNKKLSVETSIINGIGPECIKYFTLEQSLGKSIMPTEYNKIKQFTF